MFSVWLSLFKGRSPVFEGLDVSMLGVSCLFGWITFVEMFGLVLEELSLLNIWPKPPWLELLFVDVSGTFVSEGLLWFSIGALFSFLFSSLLIGFSSLSFSVLLFAVLLFGTLFWLLELLFVFWFWFGVTCCWLFWLLLTIFLVLLFGLLFWIVLFTIGVVTTPAPDITEPLFVDGVELVLVELLVCEVTPSELTFAPVIFSKYSLYS